MNGDAVLEYALVRFAKGETARGDFAFLLGGFLLLAPVAKRSFAEPWTFPSG